jgi:multiple sugar transport system permease protein
VARVPNVTKSVIDSAICSVGGTALSIIVGLLAAFGIARHRIGGEFFPIFLLSARMAPPIVAAIPLLILYSIIGLVDTHIGLIIAYACFTLPYSTWMIASFIEEIPRDLEEAAQVDGMSTLETHFKVTLPLIKGGIAATALFIFILNWSEFLLALTLTHEKVLTIPVQIKAFFTYSGQLYGPQSAFGVIAIIPLIAFSLIIQRHLVRGLTFGAIKG